MVMDVGRWKAMDVVQEMEMAVQLPVNENHCFRIDPTIGFHVGLHTVTIHGDGALIVYTVTEN